METWPQRLPQASTLMNLVQFSDDYGRITATNMLWYRGTAKSDAEPNEFGVPGAALLPADTVADDAAVNEANIRALYFANTLRNLKHNRAFRSRQEVTIGANRSPWSYA